MTASPPEITVQLFEQLRPRLRGVAYRMLGSLADADDVVQESWLRWSNADIEGVRTPEAWLTTVVTRLAIDRLRSARRRRETYPGPWLPEPLVSPEGPEELTERAESLTLGFLTLLDKLGPVERAIFILADVFGVPYAEISATIGRSEEACRQTASRARRRLRVGTPRRSAAGADRRIIDQLITAVGLADVDAVVALLAPNVICVADGGPDRRAARRPVVGRLRVARYLLNIARRNTGELSVEPVSVNGDPGLVAYISRVIELVAAFEVTDQAVTAIRIVRNPSKLVSVRNIFEVE